VATKTQPRVKSRAKSTAPGSPRRKRVRREPPPAPAPVMDGRLADRGEISRGGMGMIRRVFDTRMERLAALKVIDPNLAEHHEMRTRFLDEARITGQLDHPNIVPVHDLMFDAAGQPNAFMMKLVDGMTLAHHVANTPRNARELAKLLEIFLKICDAVAFAHSREVIHRDLKPENIMLGAFGQVYVMDWGCAHSPARSMCDVRGTVIGTPGYMAPEQATGRVDELDERTDVFGLGGILFHMLTGQPPFAGEAFDVREPQDVSSVRLPPGLCRIAMHALAIEPSGRYATVEDLRAEVEAFLRGGAFFESRTFAPGELILREGDAADVAFVITAGQCEAFRDERTRRVSLRMLGPGDVFGEGALFAAGVRNASVVAVDEVTVLVLSRESLHDELALDSWMGAFVRALAVRYRDLEARRRITSHANDHLRITQLIVDHLSRAGIWQGTNTLCASWSHLWSTLGPELRLAESQVLAIVARSGDLRVDTERDTITLAVTGV
jgi:CRP-like cAMP-binding protein/tRNA A-37 threonylcarbamoyl transferase component Bud32